MDLDVRVRHGATKDREAAAEHVAGKLRNALRRMGGKLLWVLVRLDDVNGPRGGSDKRCVVRAQTVGGTRSVGEATGPDVFGAIDRALRRALRGLRGTLSRRGRR